MAHAHRLDTGESRGAVARLDSLLTDWLARYSISLLRISLGLVFLGFGVLKFVPGLSPAEGLAQQTMDKLTLGLIPDDVGLVLVALLETAIGVSFITGRFLRLGLALLAMAMVGVLSPIVLLPERLFAGQFNAPTMEGQYVLKDIVLLAAGLVVAAWELTTRPMVAARGERKVS
jgi:putative oxidoreductase